MVAYRRGGAFCKGIVNTARRGGLPFAPAKGSKTGQRGTKLSPLQTPLTLSCAGYEYCFSLNNREKPTPYCAQMRSKGSRRRICPHRLAVPEKIFALLACSIFSTAAGEGDSIYNLYIKMRRRHLESVSAAPYGRCQASFVSSRSLSVRGSWGTAPSVFWYGAPGGTQGPLGKGGAAERWRVTPSVSWVTRHGAQPATTRTYKSRPPPGRRAN